MLLKGDVVLNVMELERVRAVLVPGARPGWPELQPQGIELNVRRKPDCSGEREPDVSDLQETQIWPRVFPGL